MHEIDFIRGDLQECLRSVNRAFNKFVSSENGGAMFLTRGFGSLMNRSEEFNLFAASIFSKTES